MCEQRKVSVYNCPMEFGVDLCHQHRMKWPHFLSTEIQPALHIFCQTGREPNFACLRNWLLALLYNAADD